VAVVVVLAAVLTSATAFIIDLREEEIFTDRVEVWAAALRSTIAFLADPIMVVPTDPMRKRRRVLG
jgi:hypothetical protein